MRSVEARRMLVGALVVGGLCGIGLAWGLDVADVNPRLVVGPSQHFGCPSCYTGCMTEAFELLSRRESRE